MMRLLIALAVAACQQAPAQGGAAAAYDFPARTGRVVDAAHILSPEDEARLAARLAEAERATRHQLVVVTVQSLGGHPVEAYSLVLANRWSVGRKGVNDGVVLLVAPNERKARIEVGRGLEKALTDDEAANIMRGVIVPRFAKGEMAQGVAAGTDAILREIAQ